MKIQIEQKDLSKLVSKVARAAATTDTVPVLQGMYLEAVNGKLIAQASDMEIGVKLTIIEVQVHEEGKILVPARNFESFVKTLPSEVITLETEDNKLMVKYGRSKANLNLFVDYDYPNFPECNEEILTISGNELRKGLLRVLPAVAKNHFRQVFNGVLLDITEDKTFLVGSDTHRLNIYEIATGSPQGQKAIIPAKTADEIMRLVEDEEVVIYTNGNNLLIKTGEKEITSRLIDGTYPNYLQVVPTSTVTEMVIKTADLKQALQRLLSLPQTKAKVPITRILLNGSVEISSSSEEGEITEYLDVQKTGEDMEINFNSNYILDAVKLMPEETKISFSGTNSPAVFKGEDMFQSVLVPVRAV